MQLAAGVAPNGSVSGLGELLRRAGIESIHALQGMSELRGKLAFHCSASLHAVLAASLGVDKERKTALGPLNPLP